MAQQRKDLDDALLAEKKDPERVGILWSSRAMVGETEAEARALGLTQLVLETGTRQTEALALYRRAGFSEISPYGEYAASSGTSVCMTKVL